MEESSLQHMFARLEKIEKAVMALLDRETVKPYYDTAELARLVDKAEYTVREWCRNGRLKAEKRRSGRGRHCAWVVSHEELLRYRRHGLLAPDAA
ncbi:MAG: helix-turn-helix domain-containing protein [Gemmataceae bacterium]